MRRVEDKYDGGPAFPNPHMPGMRGMSLRDYFASAALQALIAKSVISGIEDPQMTRAEIAYQYADAMLEARKPRTVP